jgi:hypothetical protein
MIQIRRTAEDDRLEFEVVVREGEGEPITTSRCREKLANSWRASTRRSTVSKQPSDSCSTASGKNPSSDAFDVTVISRYFPEFERELPRYLSPP